MKTTAVLSPATLTFTLSNWSSATLDLSKNKIFLDFEIFVALKIRDISVFDMWGERSCPYPYPEIFCNQLCFKVEYLIIAFSIFLLPKFVCLWVKLTHIVYDGDKNRYFNRYFRIGLNKVIYYFIKHWLLSIIFGLRTALVAIRKIFTNKNKLGFQSDAQGISYESSCEPHGYDQWSMHQNRCSNQAVRASLVMIVCQILKGQS